MITECRKFESYTVKLDIYSFHNFNIHPDKNAFDWYELKKCHRLVVCTNVKSITWRRALN